MPTLPEYGIDKAFKASDQKHWFVKCKRCNFWFALCCAWPESVRLGKDPSEDAFVCARCKRPLENRGEGEWVALKPKIEGHSGYHVSQLMSLRTSPTSFRNLGGYAWKKQFYWFKLGRPFGAKGASVNRDIVLGCENKGLRWTATGDHLLAGIDQGDESWVVIGDPHAIPDKLVIRGIFKIEDDDERLSKMMDAVRVYNFDFGVIDAEPEKKSALAFCQRFKGRMFACFYSDRQREIAVWPEDKRTVTVNRTDTLDLMMDGWRSRFFQIPPLNDICDVMIKHLENLTKQRITVEETGKQTDRYVRSGPDHLAHAMNYLLIAYARWRMDRQRSDRSQIHSSVLKRDDPVLRRLVGAGPEPREDTSEEESDGEKKTGIRWSSLTTPKVDAGDRQPSARAGKRVPPGGYETGG